MGLRKIEFKSAQSSIGLGSIFLGVFVGALWVNTAGTLSSILIGLCVFAGLSIGRFLSVQMAIDRSSRNPGYKNSVVFGRSANSVFRDDIYLSIHGVTHEAKVVAIRKRNFGIHIALDITIEVAGAERLQRFTNRFLYNPLAWMAIKPSLQVGQIVTAFVGSWGDRDNRPFMIQSLSHFNVSEAAQEK